VEESGNGVESVRMIGSEISPRGKGSGREAEMENACYRMRF